MTSLIKGHIAQCMIRKNPDYKKIPEVRAYIESLKYEAAVNLVAGILGFNGLPIIHGKPRYSEYIPWEGEVAGLTIGAVDECIGLYDKWGVLICEWPEDYEPTREDVQMEVFKHLKSIGRNIF